MTNLTIPELLSGSHDEELRVLVAEARGYCRAPKVKVGDYEYQSDAGNMVLQSINFQATSTKGLT